MAHSVTEVFSIIAAERFAQKFTIVEVNGRIADLPPAERPAQPLTERFTSVEKLEGALADHDRVYVFTRSKDGQAHAYEVRTRDVQRYLNEPCTTSDQPEHDYETCPDCTFEIPVLDQPFTLS